MPKLRTIRFDTSIGISCVTVTAADTEVFAPVIARLAGK
jgi:hypothetical protein